MAAKTANVTARVQPEIKQKAEAILDQLGIPVSVLIDSLYRQIIMTNSIPYSFRISTLQIEATQDEHIRNFKSDLCTLLSVYQLNQGTGEVEVGTYNHIALMEKIQKQIKAAEKKSA